MSDERLCGYCRQPGHNMGKCDFLKNQVHIIRYHAGMLRRDVHDLLVANGIGAGALVNVYDFWSGEMIPCVIPSLKFLQKIDSVTYKQKKYSKQVYANVPRLSLKYEDSHPLIRFTNAEKIKIECYPIADMSKTMYANFYVSLMEHRPAHIAQVDEKNRWFGDNPSKLIAASNDSDIDLNDPTVWTADCRMHPRLKTKDWMPALKPH